MFSTKSYNVFTSNIHPKPIQTHYILLQCFSLSDAIFKKQNPGSINITKEVIIDTKHFANTFLAIICPNPTITTIINAPTILDSILNFEFGKNFSYSYATPMKHMGTFNTVMANVVINKM